MADDKPPTPVVRAKDIAAAGEFVFRHPLNPNSECHFTTFDGVRELGEQVGLKRIGASIARIPPGKSRWWAPSEGNACAPTL